MHIPDQMVTGPVCPVTTAISIAGVAAAVYFAVKNSKNKSLHKFAAITALIFAMQMMNFPVQNGTSGHFLGTTLAILIFGIPMGLLSMATVVSIQCIVFSDGGFSVLGANIFNMAIAAAVPAIIFSLLNIINHVSNDYINKLFIVLASWLSVITASIFCSIELTISGTINFANVFPPMVGIHIIIGLFEGIITVSIFSFLNISRFEESEKLSFLIPAGAALIIGMILSPFASGFPDGLELVASKFHFLPESAPCFVSPLPDYTFVVISNEIIATGLAGLSGVIITFILVYVLGFLLNFKLSAIKR